MGFIFGGNFQSYGNSNITIRTTNANYPKVNMTDYWDLERHTRCNDATTNAYFFKINFGSAVSLAACFLNDVNFDKTIISGSTDDVTWVNISGTVTISNDERVGRYKVYIPLTAFNYQYFRVWIPTGTTITDSAGAWRIGTCVLLPAVTTLAKNVSYGYTVAASRQYKDSQKMSGGLVRASMGSKRAISLDIPFSRRRDSDFTELWTINTLDEAAPIVVYENEGGDTSKAYLCARDDAFSMEYAGPDSRSGNTIRFSELI